MLLLVMVTKSLVGQREWAGALTTAGSELIVYLIAGTTFGDAVTNNFVLLLSAKANQRPS
jgi:hypothetical protein